ncbi:kinase-like protein [Phyllosticta citriasiana]|uniref:EKC/KEOPS complex subunit BUD32 n=1 Tax=Phyllosticta citriasiana TaxID=595635 RepID=A0ABR1K8C6_9PEZI
MATAQHQPPTPPPPPPPASLQLPALFSSPSPSSSTTTTTTTTSTTSIPVPTLLTQGAEALVYKTSFLTPSRAAALKFRPSKPYRHPLLDRRLTRQRILAEARVLVRLRREGVVVPAVWGVDWDAGWLLLEWIPGHTIRACLDRYLHDALATRSQPALDAVREEEQGGEGDEQQQQQQQQQQQEGEQATRDHGVLDKTRVPELWDLMTRVGRAVGRMHAVGVVHGDLTTSNLMLRTPSPSPSPSSPQQHQPASAATDLAGTVTIIDFGLASQTIQDEDKAVDLYVLERAFGSTHPAAEPLFREVLTAYREAGGKAAAAVLKRLDEVRLRGRKRTMVG